jgi:hypothetical protein
LRRLLRFRLKNAKKFVELGEKKNKRIQRNAIKYINYSYSSRKSASGTNRRSGLEGNLKKVQKKIKEFKRRTGLFLLTNNIFLRYIFAIEIK